MASAGAVGVDFGSNTAKIGVAKKGGVEVITNEASHRETHVVVGFGENERFIGEQGYVQLKSNFKNTIVFPNRFLGLRSDTSFLPEEKKWLYNSLNITPENRLTFDVMYRGERKQFIPEQVTAMMLQKLKHIVRQNGIAHSDMVISVPSYYTDQERKALLDAARIAEVNTVRLLNESTAISIGYGIFRKAELNATPRNVCFVDFGHSHSSVFVTSFTNQKAKILNQIHERNLGVREIDWKLLEFYSKIILDQFDVNPIKKEKSRLRMLDAIEKQRKVLSANSEAGINVDYIAEDNDLNYTLTREKFEELALPVVNRLRTVLETLKAEIQVPLHSIEIVGGGSRIPIVQKVIQEVFGMECSRTLNASECIARGCAIQAAMLSPLFKVAQYDIEEANYYPIRCSWIFKDSPNIEVENDSKNNPEKQTSVLFDRGCSIPNIKSVTFHRDEIIDFKLFYDPIPPGADKLIAQYIVYPTKPKEQEYGVKIRAQLNKNGIVEFESAQMIEDYFEEVPADANAASTDAAQKPEPKKKTRSTKLNVDISNFHCLPEKEINQFYEEECQMANQDRVTHETYEKKNELEAYIYDVRGKLSERYQPFITPQQATILLQELEKGENWLYNEGAKSNKSTYAQRLDELRKLGDPVVNRWRESEAIPEALFDFDKNLSIYESIITSTDPSYEHITPEDRKPVFDGVNEHRNWIRSIQDSYAKANRTENFSVTSKDILNKHRAFVEKYYPVINKPKPQPQPTQTNTSTDKKPDAQTDNANTNQQENTQDGKKDMDIEK